jgi:ParB/RepB/Spo0J family partition protein
MAEPKLLFIPLKDIRENPVALRTVNRSSEEYVGLVDSIRTNGVLNPILVRECIDPDSKETFYGLIDGLHRYSASQDAGRETIPAQVTSMEDAKILEAQILANVHKVETKPIEYSKQLVRILAQNPLMPLSQLAGKLSKSAAWLNERLGLVKLDPKIASLVDEGTIQLSNAYALAKLPIEDQANFVDRAMTMSPQEFVPTATARMKEVRDAKRQGRAAAGAQEFTPVPHLRKISELRDEMTKKEIAKVLVTEYKVEDPAEAFALGIQWALHMDPASVEAARQKDAARKQQQKEEAEKRKKDREAKKEKEATAHTVSLQEQLEAVH